MPHVTRRNRRTKIVSIRVSSDEYSQLQNLCAIKGLDSISELARNAMKLLMLQESISGKPATENRVKEVDPRVRDIDARMSILDREVARLRQLVS